MEESVRTLPGIGPRTGDKLSRLGIRTISDLLYYFPKDYRDESKLTRLGNAKLGHIVAKVHFTSVISRKSRKGKNITEAIASDATGSVRVIWFGQPYRASQINTDKDFYLSGELSYKQGRVSVLSPTIESAEEQAVHTARIVPIYKESGKISSMKFRRWIIEALQQAEIQESLPEWMIKKYKLMPLKNALFSMHFPDSHPIQQQAERRLAFEEFLGFMLASVLNKKRQQLEVAPQIQFDEKLAKTFVEHLPFKLTNAQRKVVWRIYQDVATAQPMNRLVEGDVGSGKTVIAAMASLMAISQKFQVALLAPTELLARQHAESLFSLLKSVHKEKEVVLLVGSMKEKTKQHARNIIEKGESKIIVGTHALLQESVIIPNLGLIIIDEQHRFGVEQRKMLEKRSRKVPHSLYLTATPIPRSLALTLYGELDVSILDEKPKGRKPIDTIVGSAEYMQSALRDINTAIEQGHQVFVVCPLIKNPKSNADLSAAENMHIFLSSRLPTSTVGLLHGKQSAADKELTMQQFSDNKIQVLVATTVVEVGVDIPNATLMIVYGAERFGLAQLHQLRGRVGRSATSSRCILITSTDDKPPARLSAMMHLQDGFKLAEYDLLLRGPGAIYGTLQHGALDLKVAKLSDTLLLNQSRIAAEEMLTKENILDWPGLLKRTELLRSITYLN